MANKNYFTPEEWTKVLESIIAAGIAVSAVDPSGLWGTLKEAAVAMLKERTTPLNQDTIRQSREPWEWAGQNCSGPTSNE